MVNPKLVKDQDKFIQGYLDGNDSGINFNNDTFNVDGTTHRPDWNGVGFLLEGDVTEYTLPTASDSVKGGVMVGDRLTISSAVLSANQQTWSDIIAGSAAASVAAPSLGIFNNTTTNFQSLTQIQQLFSDFEAVKNVFIADGTEEDESNQSLGYANGDFVVVRNDGTQEALFNTIVDVDLSIRTGLELDPEGEDSTINPDGTYLVVNFGLSTQTFTDLTALIPTFSGSTGTHIITDVNSGVISAQLRNGTVGTASLDSTVNGILTSVANKMDLQIAAIEGNVAVFDDAGQAIDGGIALEDLATNEALEDFLDPDDGHDHDGVNSKKVDYRNLTYKPVILASNGSIEDSATFNVGVSDFDVFYRATAGSNRQGGHLQVVDGELTELMVTDNGNEVKVLFSMTGNGLGIIATNDEGAGTIALKLRIELFDAIV